jgi:vacuolar-type H+-ATPase subunit I/STV1
MVEAKASGKFSIGIGNGDAKVKSVIAPFYKVSESEAIVFVDNRFIKLSDSSEPTQVEEEELTVYPEFTEVCETFAALNFKERETEIYTKGRNLEVAFSVNEDATLSLKINGSVVEDLTKVQLTELFLLEQTNTRASLTKLFNNLDMIVNLEFAKKLVNERLDSDSIVFTVGETLYVFEKYAHSRIIKKMEGLEFHNYVMEKFNYDVSELYAIELEEREAFVRQIEEEKKTIERDLSKLEETIAQLDEALNDLNVSEEYQTQLADLKVSIEKNVNALKNQYIELEQSKKKV